MTLKKKLRLIQVFRYSDVCNFLLMQKVTEVEGIVSKKRKKKKQTLKMN